MPNWKLCGELLLFWTVIVCASVVLFNPSPPNASKVVETDTGSSAVPVSDTVGCVGSEVPERFTLADRALGRAGDAG